MRIQVNGVPYNTAVYSASQRIAAGLLGVAKRQGVDTGELTRIRRACRQDHTRLCGYARTPQIVAPGRLLRYQKGMRPKGTAKSLEDRRRRAVALRQSGRTVKEVAAEVGTTTRSMYRWCRSFRDSSDHGLDAKPASRRPRSLNPDQRSRLLELLRRGPQRCGFPNRVWQRFQIVYLIEREFGVRVRFTYVRRLFTRCKTSFAELNETGRSSGLWGAPSRSESDAIHRPTALHGDCNSPGRSGG